MKRFFGVVLCAAVLLGACKEKTGPDVSNIDVPFTTIRFEREFFSLDTTDMSGSLDNLYNKYPGFFRDYTLHIMGFPPVVDSGLAVMETIKGFLRDYRPVYDSVNKQFSDFSDIEEDVVEGLKHVKYYFPKYKLPEKLFTFIGPMDAYFEGSTGGYGDVITADGLAVGLQLHLGSNFSMYHSEMGLALFPAYLSRKFAPEYIPVNCIKNIVDDIFPERQAGGTLIEQMVEKGKRIFLIDRLMPDTPDTLKIGYTKKQLDGCLENEGFIWNFFVKNGLVFNNDPSLIKNYVGESPNTPEFGEGAPGNIGLFVGWQIVKKYLLENPDTTIEELMSTDPKTIFEGSKYRPR